MRYVGNYIDIIPEGLVGYLLNNTGQPRPKNIEEKHFTIIKELGMEDRVEFLGYIPDEDLPKLYQEATLFVYPSLHEGFGIPVLEAMRCGCPVVTSKVSSLPEVGGDAVFYIDPKDVQAIEKAILKIVDNKSLQAELRLEGLKQADKFSWKHVAEKTKEALC